MIQLENLRIQDFRGIRLIDLPLGGKTFVVHGPNGSGKSGIIDAIDFALTGNIGRLAGAGMGNVSLTKHGPHVSKRDDPGAAVVELTVKDVASGEVSILKRSIKDAAKFTLSPDLPSVRTSVLEAQSHPELTLSRREIIRYVVAKPADRAAQVQSLLQLSRMETFRKLLKSTVGKASGELRTAESAVSTAEAGVQAHLRSGALLATDVEREVNRRRTVLDLKPLSGVTIDSNLDEGMKAAEAGQAFNLATAKRESNELKDAFDAQEPLINLQNGLRKAIEDVKNDPSILESLKHRSLVESGIQALVDNHCPLCDHEWDSPEELRSHLNRKIERSDSAKEFSAALTNAATEYRTGLTTLKSTVDKVLPIAKSHGEPELHARLTTFSATLLAHETSVGSAVSAILGSYDSLIPTVFAPESEILDEVIKLVAAIEDEPDQSAVSDAQSFLTIAQERWLQVRVARSAKAKAQAVSDNIKLAYDKYCEEADAALEALYKTVEVDFSRYYQIINADDEGSFSAELKPLSGSLELAVDFYGEGKFPPNAYHSEGHQDGMGVCLYLALVKQLLGDDFRYSVLDDVVMSVDTSHRRQFCRLLKEEFPGVQFIITTHDAVWARQMQTEGLITSKAQARFYGWNVQDGPLYEHGDIWDRIDEDLLKEDVAGAAHKLRRHLEAAAGDLADNLRAPVPYRGDNAYDPSILLNAVKGQYKNLLAKAAKSANKWGNEAAKAEIEALKEDRGRIIPDQEGEAWLVNKLVHNNDWVNASVADFRPVLEATREFFGLFLCSNEKCTGWIRVHGVPEDALRCDCSTYNLNLLS